MILSLTITETFKMALLAAHLNAGHSGGDCVAIGIYTLHTPFSPSLISLTVSVDVKHHVYLLTARLNT